jgi:hypothetical protein
MVFRNILITNPHEPKSLENLQKATAFHKQSYHQKKNSTIKIQKTLSWYFTYYYS